MGIAASSDWAGADASASIGFMPLHLIKLAVGAESLARDFDAVVLGAAFCSDSNAT